MFQFQRGACHGCHDVLIMSIILNDIANLNIRGVDYHCIINGISKCEAVNLFQKADLSEKSENQKYNFSLSYIKDR